jgi:hypothetical protein
MSIKNPMTPSGIKPTTFQFVEQYLNHCATACPARKSRTACISHQQYIISGNINYKLKQWYKQHCTIKPSACKDFKLNLPHYKHFRAHLLVCECFKINLFNPKHRTTLHVVVTVNCVDLELTEYLAVKSDLPCLCTCEGCN